MTSTLYLPAHGPRFCSGALPPADLRGLSTSALSGLAEEIRGLLIENWFCPSRRCPRAPGFEIRTKREPSDPMHLKSYQIDGTLLRTGAANCSASGLKRQDNDLIVIESAGAAAAVRRDFNAQYASGEALPVGVKR